VILVPSHNLAWTGLRAALLAFPDLLLLGAALHGAEALAQIVQLAPDLVVASGDVPGLPLVTLLTEVRTRVPRACLVLILDQLDRDVLQTASRFGVEGCLLWSEVTPGKFHRIITLVAGDDCVVGTRRVSEGFFEALRTRRQSRPPGGVLTPRQREILLLLADGLSDQEVARRLRRSRSTVASHIQAIATRVGARNRAQVCLLAARQGLLPDGVADTASARQPQDSTPV